MQARQPQNPGAELYTHWMKLIHKQAVEGLNYTQEAMKKYYNQKVLQLRDYKEGDLVMLNRRIFVQNDPQRN